MKSILIIIFLATPCAFAQSLATRHILFIGDSHSQGSLGVRLDELLRQRVSHYVDSYAVGGSVPSYWLDGTRGKMGYVERHADVPVFYSEKQLTPRIDFLLATYKPSLVVVEQGTNCIWDNDDKACADSVNELVKTISLSVKTCVWIGPPRVGKILGTLYNKRVEEVRSMLKEIISPTSCHWVDSFPYTRYPDDVANADGIHYDSAGPRGIQIAKKWAESVEEEIEKIPPSFEGGTSF